MIVSAPKLTFRLRLSYAEWERNMLAGTLGERRAELAAFAERLQPEWDKAWEATALAFENLLLYGTSHPDFDGFVRSPASHALPTVREANEAQRADLAAKSEDN